MLERPQLGVIMDPLDTIHPEKDTTLALLAEADRRGFALYYMELGALFTIWYCMGKLPRFTPTF